MSASPCSRTSGRRAASRSTSTAASSASPTRTPSVKADKVSLQLDNFDLALFDREELIGGATLEVSWGYPGNMAPPRRVVVKKLKGFQTLTIEGQAHQRADEPRGQDARVDEQVAQRRGQGDRRRARLRGRVRGRRGHRARCSTPSTRPPRRTRASSGASRHGRSSSTSSTTAGSTGARAIRRARRATCSPGSRTQGAATSSRSTSSPTSSRRTGRVEVRGRDPLTKATIESRASSSTVERATLSDVLEVVDPETGSSSLQERNATTSVHPTSAPTPAAAERESAARFRRAERETVKLSMQVVGDPTLRAKEVRRGARHLAAALGQVLRDRGEARHLVLRLRRGAEAHARRHRGSATGRGRCARPAPGRRAQPRDALRRAAR